MSKRDPLLLLSDILDSIEKIREYTKEHSFATFIEDSKTLDAVIRISKSLAKRQTDSLKT
jgi:uncharacterized protein with HEPN domain